MSELRNIMKTFEGKSQLEKTIINNRSINQELYQHLLFLEHERKRRLVSLLKEQRIIRAEAKVRKDEKFRIMLEKQAKQTADKDKPQQKVSIKTKTIEDDRSETNIRHDIERALFTSGVVNAPGVNHRMQRLKSRTRILPNLNEDDSDSENSSSDKKPEFTSHREKASPKTFLTEKTFDSQPLNTVEDDNYKSKIHHAHCSSSHPIKHQTVPIDKPRRIKALVRMTSGLCNIISEDAEIKHVQEKDANKELSQPNANPFSHFSIHTKRPVTAINVPRPRSSTPSNGREWAGVLSIIPAPKKVMSRRIINKDDSEPDILQPPSTAPVTRRTYTRNTRTPNLSRLSIIKTKIASDEREYLIKLRHKSQEVENEKVFQKVWKFIGSKPISCINLPGLKQSSENDILSAEEEVNLKKRFAETADTTLQVFS